MITMTEITLGNFSPVCRFLAKDINEWYSHFILVYKVAVGFAMLKVLSGVFLHETFRTAGSDDELMVVQKRRAQQEHEKKMLRLFKAIDTAQSGHISRADFEHLFHHNPTLKIW